MSRAFSVNFYGDCFSFGLGFVERSLKPLSCWGYESKTPIGRKNLESSNYMMFRRIGGP